MFKRILAGIVGAIALTAAAVVPAGATSNHNNVTICHNTGSGHVTIEVSPSAVITHIVLHGDTLGPCVDPTPTATPSPTPTATPTVEPTPEVTPTPEPTVEPTATPTPEVEVVVEDNDPCTDIAGAGTHSVAKPADYDSRPQTLRDPDCGQFAPPATATVLPPVSVTPAATPGVLDGATFLPLPAGGFAPGASAPVPTVEVKAPHAGDGFMADRGGNQALTIVLLVLASGGAVMAGRIVARNKRG